MEKQQNTRPHKKQQTAARNRPKPVCCERKHSVSGVAIDSARRISEYRYCTNFSASRMESFEPQPGRLLLRCRDVPVTTALLQWSQTAGQICPVWMSARWSISPVAIRPGVHLSCLAGRRHLHVVGNYSSWFPACPPLRHFPPLWGRLAYWEFGGHQGSSSVESSTSVSPVARSSSDEGSSTCIPCSFWSREVACSWVKLELRHF